MPAETAFKVSEDAVLGGRLVLRQPLKGHRVGHDAILLAAACAAFPGDRVVDLGSGVGAAGLAVARRVEDVALTLVEVDPKLTALARDNIASNNLGERVRAVCLDVAAAPGAFAVERLMPGSADRVLMNPPFNAGAKPFARPRPSARPHRRGRHTRDMARHGCATSSSRRHADADLAGGRSLRSACRTLRRLWCGDGIAGPSEARRRGDRVLIRAVKASRAPLALLPGFILADAAGRPTTEAERVLREGAVLPLAEN